MKSDLASCCESVEPPDSLRRLMHSQIAPANALQLKAISMCWHKIFQLNVEVGVRSVFGFDPSRGDLAFDGENGVIRVLPGREPTKPTHQPAVRRGMDIFFDELPVNFALDQDTVTIESTPKSCETAKGLSLDTSR